MKILNCLVQNKLYKTASLLVERWVAQKHEIFLFMNEKNWAESL